MQRLCIFHLLSLTVVSGGDDELISFLNVGNCYWCGGNNNRSRFFHKLETVSQSEIATKRSPNGDLYQKISSLFHKICDYVKSSSDSDTLGERAAELAVQVIGAPYLGDGKTWGGKGYEWNHSTGSWRGGKFVEPDEIMNGYWYWNNKEGKVMLGRGLDCSGLSFWAFNKAAGATKLIDSSNPICSDRASKQWKDKAKFEQISTKIPTVSDLESGYLLFIDANSNGLADHVGMYVGNGAVIHSKWGVGVEKKTLKDWLNIPVAGGNYKKYFVGFGRVNKLLLGLREDYELLLKLGDPVGKKYGERKGRMIDAIKRRNYSISAHGLTPLVEADYLYVKDKLKGIILDAANEIGLNLAMEQLPGREILP